MATEGCPWSWASRKRRRIRKPPPNLAMIGDDLLVEILIRLPNHRFASGCKPVCKRWRSLISSPRFNRRFVSHHRINNQPTMPDNPDDLQSIILSFLPPMPSAVAGCFKVLDCFKDLVLCGFWDLDSDNKELCRSYFICNPFTKQWMALPLAPEKATGYKSHCTRFVFESRISYDLDMEGGDDEQKVVYSEYRFRVVSVYQHDESIKLDWFCSQSAEECEPVEGVGLFGHRRKDKGPAANPCHRVKKQKVMNGSCSRQYGAIGRKSYVKDGALISCRRNRRQHLFN
ncbi:unnamed protein product [Linum tenue]|uniref:F-box domain-containing protein n=1 Tax=Linum tenue TaxID=586396 RepID=A0AAV0GPG4_9ROSI|nr:unnamed protein product [Linum tenue]